MFFTTIDNIPEISEEELPENLSGEFLQEAICGLPSGCRTIFILIEVEGYSHREVAEMLGISEGTSKSQLFHAKKLLKRKCKEFQG
jgi:RNA polymerase sigma factor (sigma-70 family)